MLEQLFDGKRCIAEGENESIVTIICIMLPATLGSCFLRRLYALWYRSILLMLPYNTGLKLS